MLVLTFTVITFLTLAGCGNGSPESEEKSSGAVQAANGDGPCDPDNGGIDLPDGFCATVVADDLGTARHLTVRKNGDVYVFLRQATRQGGIVALRDTNDDGKADRREYFGNLDGTRIALHNGYLYVSPGDGVIRYPLKEDELVPSAEPETVVSELYAGSSHAARSITFDNEGNFYFIEMNTRLQVEHTVTEMITGEDIVEHQLRIADGEPLEFVQDDFKMHGHSIQCRIYAENPDKNFMPAPGEITNYSEPQGEGVRVDSGARENFEITRYYDPLVAKLVTHADTRSAAIDKMVDAINNYEIGGLTTNKEMHLDVLQSDEFQDGTVHTSWLEERY
jgi:hypothetical protein